MYNGSRAKHLKKLQPKYRTLCTAKTKYFNCFKAINDRVLRFRRMIDEAVQFTSQLI